MEQVYDASLDRDGRYGVAGVVTAESQRRSPRTRGAGPEKTFKACRACRRLKMRCEGSGTCSRCTVTGTECIFDRIGTSRARRAFNREDQEKAKRQRLEDLETELRVLRTELPPAAIGEMPTTNSSGGNIRDYTGGSIAASSTPVPPERNEGQTHNQLSDPYSLTPGDLQAPVTAVHAMIPDSTHTQRLYPTVFKPQDCISREIVSEAQGRRLFNLFMTGSNAFLPILDPVQDTFDSVRIRSPFCFCVILAIAARAEATDEASQNIRQACDAEAKRLGGESLFIGVPRLEDVQAMTLLAAFSERNWFAIGHAMQMALALGLPNALPQLLQNHHTATPQNRRQDKLLARHARTWLTVLHIDWEIACGTARQPRREQQIDYLILRAFATHTSSCASDSRILAIIELVQLRGRIQHHIEASNDLAVTAMARVREADAEFYSWWRFWDQFQEDSDYPQTSLQRASLIFQRDYASIFTCCAVLGKFQLLTSQKSQGSQEDCSSETTVSEVLTYVTTVIMNLLTFISQSAEYRWNLKWAPTYSGLAIAFTTALALKVCRLRPDVVDGDNMRILAEEILRLLETYPYKNFHRLISLLLTLPPAGPIPVHPVHQQDQFGRPEGLSGDSIFVQPPERFKAIECHSGPEGPTRSPYHSSDVVVPITNSIPTSIGSHRIENIRSGGSVQYNPDVSSFEDVPRTSFAGGEAPSWIFDTGSTGSFALPNQGSCSLFDFDMRLIMDDAVFNSESHHGL